MEQGRLPRPQGGKAARENTLGCENSMILSAVALWKKFDTSSPLNPSEWGETKDEKTNGRYCHVTYSGNAVADGSVRIYAQFGKPAKEGKFPAVLLLPDVGKPLDRELVEYFVAKGYAVLMPDYTGKTVKDAENTMRTVYPPSLRYAGYDVLQGFAEFGDFPPEQTCWFQWVSVALYSIEYLKSRGDISSIGVVGVRTGGEIAWKVMLSPDVRCGVPINAAGWTSSAGIAKFGDDKDINMSAQRHAYIAGVESQSYAPFVKCPVLMLCALRDARYDVDRAYDTFSRVGYKEGNAITYSPDSGSCIGPRALEDLNLFLEKNLKGREIYIPDGLNVSLKEEGGQLIVNVEGDEEGLLEEVGVFYAEADVHTKSAYREWQQIYRAEGRSVKDGKFSCSVKPYAGATAAFAYAYARYINGFQITSRITAKKFPQADATAIKNRMLYAGDGLDCFGVFDFEEYSLSGIFLEGEALPKIVKGYGGISGAYSVGGIKTYKISSPQFIPEENALLEFDVHFKKDGELFVSVDTANVAEGFVRYTCVQPVKGGGKWKRIVLRAADFKNEETAMALPSFADGKSLSFVCEEEDTEFAVTNIIWL